MPKLAKNQLIQIAQDLHDLAVTVAQFRLDRIHAGTPLTDPGIVQLLGLQWNLTNLSGSFYVQAAKVILDDADKAAAQVGGATKAANDAIKKITIVNKVLTIGSAVALVVAAVMTGQLNQVVSAATGVYKAIANGSGS